MKPSVKKKLITIASLSKASVFTLWLNDAAALIAGAAEPEALGKLFGTAFGAAFGTSADKGWFNFSFSPPTG